MTYQTLYPQSVIRTESVGVAAAAGMNQCRDQPRDINDLPDALSSAGELD